MVPERFRNSLFPLTLLVVLGAFAGASVPPELFVVVLLGVGVVTCVWIYWPERHDAEVALLSTLGVPGSGEGFEVQAVISDVDGVLTDGRIGRLSDGSALRQFHVHDGIGHKALVRAGVKVAWLSATVERESILGRARMVGLEESLVDTGEGDKGPRFEALCRKLGVEPARVVYLGDDVNDLPAMERAGLSVCPADAHPTVLAAAAVVLGAPGGRGAFRELADAILHRPG